MNIKLYFNHYKQSAFVVSDQVLHAKNVLRS
jgi:hypothetical protein